MPWNGVYYYRSRRINGKPRRVYVGSGMAGMLAAEEDQRISENKKRERSQAARLRAEHAEQDSAIAEVLRFAEALSKAALYAAGYHQHCHGDWRLRRELH